MNDLAKLSQKILSDYMPNPLDVDVSPQDKLIPLVSSVGLGILTLGFLYMVYRITCGRTKFTLANKQRSSFDSQVDAVAGKHLGKSTKFSMTPKQVERTLMNEQVNCEPTFNPFEINEHKWIANGPRNYFSENPNETASSFANKINACESLKTVINLMTAEEKEENKEQYNYTEFLSKTINPIDFNCWKDKQALESVDMANLLSLAKKTASLVKEGDVVFAHCKRGLQRTPTFIAITELFARDREEMQKKSYDEIKELIISDLQILAKTAIGRIPTLNQLEMLFSDAFIDKVKAAL